MLQEAKLELQAYLAFGIPLILTYKICIRLIIRIVEEVKSPVSDSLQSHDNVEISK